MDRKNKPDMSGLYWNIWPATNHTMMLIIHVFIFSQGQRGNPGERGETVRFESKVN